MLGSVRGCVWVKPGWGREQTLQEKHDGKDTFGANPCQQALLEKDHCCSVPIPESHPWSGAKQDLLGGHGETISVFMSSAGTFPFPGAGDEALQEECPSQV